MKKGIRVMYDYDGMAYTVIPCWWSNDSRVHYCGAFATGKESWRRVPELTPNRNILTAWHDLDVYIENIDRQAVMREADEDAKKTVPIDD